MLAVKGVYKDGKIELVESLPSEIKEAEKNREELVNIQEAIQLYLEEANRKGKGVNKKCLTYC